VEDMDRVMKALRKAPEMYTVEDLNVGRPAELGLFIAVEMAIRSLRPITMDLTMIQVSFGNSSQFAGFLSCYYVRELSQPSRVHDEGEEGCLARRLGAGFLVRSVR
jgi:hypothetical protein